MLKSDNCYCGQLVYKKPSEMDLAPRYTAFTVYTVCTIQTVLHCLLFKLLYTALTIACMPNCLYILLRKARTPLEWADEQWANVGWWMEWSPWSGCIHSSLRGIPLRLLWLPEHLWCLKQRWRNSKKDFGRLLLNMFIMVICSGIII